MRGHAYVQCASGKCVCAEGLKEKACDCGCITGQVKKLKSRQSKGKKNYDKITIKN